MTIFVAAAGTIPKSFAKDKLLNLLKFYFEDKTLGLSSMKCGALIDLVQKKRDNMNSVGTATDFDVDIGNALVDALAEEAFTAPAEGTVSIESIRHMGAV